MVCLLRESGVVWESSDAHTEPHTDRETQTHSDLFAPGMAKMIKQHHDQWLK